MDTTNDIVYLPLEIDKAASKYIQCTQSRSWKSIRSENRRFYYEIYNKL